MNEHLDPMDAEPGEAEIFTGDLAKDTSEDMVEDGAEDAFVGDDDGEEDGPGRPRRAIPTTPPDLQESITSLDALLAEADDEEKIKAGMGIRLALGMAQELKAGKPLGSETADLVAGWVNTYGQDVVETAVKVAREFLIKPDEMRKVLGSRLGMDEAE